MSRNVLFLVIAVLVVGVGVLAYQLQRERANNGTIELKVQENGIKLDTK